MVPTKDTIIFFFFSILDGERERERERECGTCEVPSVFNL